MRESNPPNQLGKLGHYHYANPAVKVIATKRSAVIIRITDAAKVAMTRAKCLNH